MSMEQSPREALAARLLAQQEQQSGSPTDAHPEDEALALFAEGNLSDADRANVIAHVADCVECRETVALLLVTSDDAAELVQPAAGQSTDSRTKVPTIPLYRRWPIQLMALAAGLLILVSGYTLISNRRQQLAEVSTYNAALAQLTGGKFDEVKATVDRARTRHISSPRLDNLTAQALRKIPSTIAFNAGGKLTQFGVGIGGILARDLPQPDEPTRAQLYELFEANRAADVDSSLNECHFMLTRNLLDAALIELHSVVADHPQNPWVWLGLGNAHYLLADYDSAADAFQQCLKLDPENLPARMNLAMTLEELGRPAAAVAAWEQLLTEHAASLTEDERKQIDAQIQLLKDAAR